MINLFWEFFKIGLFTIGGGAAMIPQIQHVATVEKGWLDDEEMLDCIAVGQSLPGVIAINIATYVGYRKRGLAGALMATFGVALPAFLSIIILVAVLGAIGDNRFVAGAFMGIKAAVCGLLIVSSIKLLMQMCGKGAGSRPVGKSRIVFTVIMSLASLIAVGFFGLTAVAVILAGIVIGIVYYRVESMKSSQEVQK
ncbi:MAG: chromate transporter [Firmicutes bacterium]|nr:chromate transporter [Bacillota bacterium]